MYKTFLMKYALNSFMINSTSEKPRFLPSSFSDTNDKNPVLARGRDFYFLFLTSLLLPQTKFFTRFLEK